MVTGYSYQIDVDMAVVAVRLFGEKNPDVGFSHRSGLYG
jgi:hypothetical protein